MHLNHRNTKRLILVVHYASNSDAPTLEELQKGEGAGFLVPIFEDYIHREHKQMPEPVEVENLQVQAS